MKGQHAFKLCSWVRPSCVFHLKAFPVDSVFAIAVSMDASRAWAASPVVRPPRASGALWPPGLGCRARGPASSLPGAGSTTVFHHSFEKSHIKNRLNIKTNFDS